MQITTQTDDSQTDLIAALYSAVDARDAQKIGAMVSHDVVFQLGNFDALHGRQAVVDANEAFFGTIANMAHTITRILSDGGTVFCAGTVHYTRHDGSELEIPFATALQVTEGLITDYRVFVDVSPL